MLLRGFNVLVLNEVIGVVMFLRWFDIYEFKEDSGFFVEFFKSLK